MKKQNQKTKTRALFILFGKAIYSVFHERSNITAYFAEQLKFQKQVTFTHALWMNSTKWKWEKLKLGHCTSSKCYVEGASWMKRSHWFFHGASNI